MAKPRLRTKKVRSPEGVFLERMDKKIDHVLEGHAVLDRKIDEFRYETRQEIKFLRFAQDVLNNKLDDLTIKMEKNFTVIREYLSRIDDEIQDLRKRLTAKADLERLEAVERKLAAVQLVVKKFYAKE